MNKITLKYPALQVPTEAEQKDILDVSAEITPFSAFIAYADENHEQYQNPIERLECITHMIDSTPLVEDKKLDDSMNNVNNRGKQILQALATEYKAYSDKEKSNFDIINRLESELETRQFLQLAIETASTSVDYFECAILANEILGEQEVVFKLFTTSIELLENSIGTSDYYLNIHIERMTFNEQQKGELKTQLQNKVKSLT